MPAATRTRPSIDPAAVPSASSRALAALLARYPDLSAAEIAALAAALKAASHLDVGLISSDDELGPRLRRFRAEQANLLRTPLWRQLLFIIACLLPIVLLTLATINR